MTALLQQAFVLSQCVADGSATECKDCVQLLKVTIDSNMNSLKHSTSKT
jgi:hypothetical protein